MISFLCTTTVQADTSFNKIKIANAKFKINNIDYYSMVADDNSTWKTNKEFTISSGKFDWANAIYSSISCNTPEVPEDANNPEVLNRLDLFNSVITMISSFVNGGRSGITDVKTKLQSNGNDHRIIMMYGTPIEYAYQGKTLWLNEIVTMAHSDSSAYFIWAKDDADKIIRSCFSGLKSTGKYNMKITYAKDFKQTPYGYTLVLSKDWKMYAYPILHTGTKMEVYYTPDKGKTEYAFDATTLIKSEKLAVSDQVKNDVINYINNNFVNLPVQSPSIKLDKTNVNLYTTVPSKKCVQLKATVKGKSKKVTWKSSNPSIAVVNQKGKVTAKKTGIVTITAKANGKSTTCKITVIKPTIKLNKSKATMYTSETKTLQLKASIKGPSKKVIWSSSNKSVATVNSKGKVTAKKPGTVTITAKANGVLTKCIITVKYPAPSIKLNSQSEILYLYGNKTFKLNATITGKSQKVSWKSANPKVATVNSVGIVTAKQVGSTVIIATANKKTAKCNITVQKSFSSADIREKYFKSVSGGGERLYFAKENFIGNDSSVTVKFAAGTTKIYFDYRPDIDGSFSAFTGTAAGDFADCTPYSMICTKITEKKYHISISMPNGSTIAWGDFVETDSKGNII